MDVHISVQFMTFVVKQGLLLFSKPNNSMIFSVILLFISLSQSRLEQKLVSSRSLERDMERMQREKEDVCSENTR